MRIVTLSPVFTPFALKTGVDPRSPYYGEVVSALPAESENITAPHRASARGADYENLDVDGYDLRLVIWRPASAAAANLRFHIYPNAVTIAEIDLEIAEGSGAAAMEAEAQSRTRELIRRTAPDLTAFLKDIAGRIPEKYLEHKSYRTASVGEDISWIARTIVMTETERSDPRHGALLEDWLEHTAKPEDATKITAGELDYSMTWLNYVLVDRGEAETGMRLSAMRIAQFFYAAQDALNDQTQMSLARAYFMKNIREVEAMLVDARARTQMLRIQYDIQKSYLNRKKRRVVDEIMAVWDFQALIDNGARMIEASSSKISEISTRRAERNSLVTDLILVGIGLLTVIEVSLYLTEYSREVMSRPALEYQDSQLSWILASVAAIDTDVMLLGGALAVIILVLVYVYWKTKK